MIRRLIIFLSCVLFLAFRVDAKPEQGSDWGDHSNFREALDLCLRSGRNYDYCLSIARRYLNRGRFVDDVPLEPGPQNVMLLQESR